MPLRTAIRISRWRPSARLLIALCFLLFNAASVDAQASKSAPLVGIRKIKVVIEDLDEDGSRAGLSTDRLRTITELKLRLAGVQVLSQEEDRADPDINPYLYVNITIMSMSEGARFVCSVVVSLRRALLSPINQALVPALLWERGGIAASGRSAMPKYAEDYVGEFLDAFINDYLAANPKR